MKIKMFKYGQVKFLSIFLCAAAFLLYNPARCHSKWTVIVYMAGDNALDSSFHGEQVITDLNEMELGIDNTTAKLIVLCDRRGDNDTYIYDIQHDTDTSLYSSSNHGIVTSTRSVSVFLPSVLTNELNMGDPANLVAFSTWAAATYPAENYMMVLWNHGSGWLNQMSPRKKKAIASDETDTDFLTMDELSSALEAATSSIGKKIDIIGFDDCFMAQIEVAYQLKGYADYIIGSEELMPDNGWPYGKVMAEVSQNPNYGKRELAVKITNIIYDSYLVLAASNTITISAIDLGKIDNLKNAVINFADGMISIRKMPSIYNAISTIILPSVDYFGSASRDKYGGVDLYDLAYKIELSTAVGYMGLKLAAAAVETAVNDCVIANSTGPEHRNSGGISINFPISYEAWFETNNPDNYYSLLKFAKDSNWNYFLNNFYDNSIFTPNTLFYVVSAPNPYNPNSGRLAVRNFPESSHINLKIYSLDGSLVRSIEADGEMIEWDGKNESGSAVASGMYFYTAKTAIGTAKGKITVVKK